MRLLVLILSVLSCRAALADAPAVQPRPQLQIINGSSQSIDIFWLNDQSERIPNGTLQPGADLSITTTLGHRFAIVGQQDKTEATISSVVPVQGFRFDPTAKEGIPAFYTQQASANGFPIVASDGVNPLALQEAAWIVNQMLVHRPDIRDAMINSGARLCVMAHDEFTTDLPEFSHLGTQPFPEFPELSGKDYWDARARGTGGSRTDPFCSCAEENLLGYPGDPYHQECILIHEFAHCVHLRGMLNVDPTFDQRLEQTYQQAMAAGLWKAKYASVNHHEYFAEGVQSWFGNNRVNDHDHNHVHTREQLLQYDPGLAAMCREVFGETEIQYTKPVTRLRDHLVDYDPATAPTFVWPQRLMHAQTAIRKHAKSRGNMENDTHETRQIAGWTLHISQQLRQQNSPATEQAVQLLERQLEEILAVVPQEAAAQLQTIPLWFSPEYPDLGPRAEYHPSAQWLKEHQRDPAMAQGVEFTNVRIFEEETRRMPNFALHELAHGYHDQVLKDGFSNKLVKQAYEKAKASGTYDDVERQDAAGNKHRDLAYAMTNPQEYFAETSEAFFARNDFYPYDREQLKAHDPDMFALLSNLWGVEAH